MKHGRQQRQLGALIRMYRRLATLFVAYLRKGPVHEMYATEIRLAEELRALERRLPPEMVAWAKLNR